MSAKLSRRGFVRSAAIMTGGTILAACQPKVVEKVVKETVEVEKEKVVKETVVVKEQVTQIVEKEVTKIVEKEIRCQMDWTPTFPPAPKKYDPPIEMAVIWEDLWDLPDPYTWDNNPQYNRILEYTGIKYTVHWVGGGDVKTTKLAADMAAGTLPDQFDVSGVVLAQVINEGLVADITDVWESTASPLVIEKKEYPTHPWWPTVMRNGRIFGVPFSDIAGNTDQIPFIRQDLLDKLGLPAPTTVQEWGEVAKASVDAGLTEFGINFNKNLVTWDSSMDIFFGAYGVMPTCWVPDGSGGLKLDTISPACKDVLAILRGWYADGLIDPDFYTLGEGDARGHISGGKCLMGTGLWAQGRRNATYEAENPGWAFSILPYPKGPDGKMGRKATPAVQGKGVVFRKGLDPIAIEAAINNLNWRTEMHVNWLKYQQYGEYDSGQAFSEGIEWVWNDNCELAEGPEPHAYYYTSGIDWGFPYGLYPSYQYDVFKDMKPWFEADPSTLNKAQRYLISSPAVKRNIEYYSYIFETLDITIQNEWYGVATDNMIKLLPDLDTLYKEVFTNIIIGNEPLDRFDSFVEEWKQMGGDQVTEDVSNWYKAKTS